MASSVAAERHRGSIQEHATHRWWLTVVAALFLCPYGRTQDLAPRAYVITPIHANAVVTTYSFFSGNLDFQGAVPIADATATANTGAMTLFHSMSIFDRNASLTITLPYGEGNFTGSVYGAETNAYRSGLFDSVYRFSINLIGGPAMSPAEFRTWRQKQLLGVSIRMIAPTGQYDGTRLVNFGTNRWAFKPEVGYSSRKGHWIVDAYAGAFLYATNPQFFSKNAYFPDARKQTQRPVYAFEGHLSYDLRPRLWVSLDGNFWAGGQTSLNGVPNPGTTQRSSRLGGTASIPLSTHHSVKFSYSNGAYVRYGGNFQNVSVAWQYSWLGRPN